jgi:hypothetical protein
MINTKQILATSLAGVALLVVGVSGAADGKNYAASQCVRWSGGAISYNLSSIYNGTASDSYVDCPAVKDSSSIASGYVKAKDRSPGSGVECSLNSLYVSGSGFFGWQSAVVSTGGSADTWLNMSFGALGADAAGYYYYSCKIPAVSGGNASSIAMYHVNEN